ncbi:MAG: glycosylhydrolase-like jelly roll fold domain-containing protein, partial [Prolixibacteraceae bacterium]
YTLLWSDGQKQVVSMRTAARILPLEGSWEVHFDPKWGGPEMIVADELKSWTEFKEPGVKYYSGTAGYKKSFMLKKKEIKGKQVMLNLGNLHEMAAVTLNGHRFNLCWTPPFELDVTAYLADGENRLEIEITNLWPNRLIGDGKLPEDQRLTKTNINKFETAEAESLLRVSGLLGPVRLMLFEEIKL